MILTQLTDDDIERDTEMGTLVVNYDKFAKEDDEWTEAYDRCKKQILDGQKALETLYPTKGGCSSLSIKQVMDLAIMQQRFVNLDLMISRQEGNISITDIIKEIHSILADTTQKEEAKK